MKNYVGRKCKGFRFEDGTDDIRWSGLMEDFIGKLGLIYDQYDNSVRINFENDSWSYPISLIEPHLIPETPEIPQLSLVDALVLVRVGWKDQDQKDLYDRCNEIIKKESQRLRSIYLDLKPKYTKEELVKIVGHDFEMV
jgi:hypothetical protein